MKADRISCFIIVMLAVISLTSISQFTKIPVSHAFVFYIAGYSLIFLSIANIFNNKELQSCSYIFPFLYLCWVIFGVVRGFLEVSGYFNGNQLIRNSLSISSPILIFLLFHPTKVLFILREWNRIIVVLSLSLFGWCLAWKYYAFLIVPFYCIYLLFFKYIPKNWKCIVLCLSAIVLFAIDNRSGVLKVSASLGMLVLLYLPNRLRTISLYILHFTFYLAPIVLLYLGITGQYNIFSGRSTIDDNEIVVFGEDSTRGRVKTEYNTDTRTFLYEECIYSAFANDYVIFGRSPARGYNSPRFFDDSIEPIPGLDPDERMTCEVAHLNTFTWLGLVGIILITLVYFQGSLLAMLWSNNYYIKTIAVSVAFQWFFGWIENENKFMLMDVTIFLMLALCYSSYFRRMSNAEFRLWFQSLFSDPKEISVYHKFQITKFFVKRRIIEHIKLGK